MGKDKTERKERTERKPNWREYTATVEDIQNFIMDRVLLRHNVITRRVEYRWPTPDPFPRKGRIRGDRFLIPVAIN